MTELERAREHLIERQEMLAAARGSYLSIPGYLETMEDCFLAALSWVWEEQEKEETKAFANRMANRMAIYRDITHLWVQMAEPAIGEAGRGVLHGHRRPDDVAPRARAPADGSTARVGADGWRPR